MMTFSKIDNSLYPQEKDKNEAYNEFMDEIAETC